MFVAQLCADCRLSSKVMVSILWFLLIFSISEASSEENTQSNESVSSSELRSPVFALADAIYDKQKECDTIVGKADVKALEKSFTLADAIYDKQKECDSIVGEAVIKALEKGVSNKFPLPDERYFQCKKYLDEKKREYIKTALVGLNYYSKVFPMILSNKQLLTLPVPTDDSISTGADPEFDIQQELCMTNKLCLTLIGLKFSNLSTEDLNEQTKSVSRCLTFLNNLKFKYIYEKKIEESELKKGQGLSLMCTDGAVTLTLPEKMNGVDYHTTSPSKASEEPQTKPPYENDEENKDSTVTKPAEDIHRKNYNSVVRELNTIFEKKSKNEEIAEQQYSDNEVPNVESGDKKHPLQGRTENDVSSKSETITQEVGLPDIKTDDITTEKQDDISELPESEISSSDKTLEGELARSEPSEDVGPSQELGQLSTSKSEDIPRVSQDTKSEIFENISTYKKPETTPNNDDGVTNEKSESTKTKSGKKKPQKLKEGENMELLTYRVKFVTKNGDGKVVRLKASGQIKKTERTNPTSNLQGLHSTSIGPKSEDDAKSKSDFGLVNTPTEANEAKRRRIADSLEDNIILIENDCKELLQFGEQLLQHKMLSSLINLEKHYDECIKKLDALKKMYIEKHQLDVMSHKNIFPLTLPSGDQKLVSLPTQFLKTDFVESQSSSNLAPGDAFEPGEFFRKNDQSENPTSNNRQPFDDPAFISNDEFLESLQQGAAPPDTSTLSKVASILHMNNGHTEKINAE